MFEPSQKLLLYRVFEPVFRAVDQRMVESVASRRPLTRVERTDGAATFGNDLSIGGDARRGAGAEAVLRRRRCPDRWRRSTSVRPPASSPSHCFHQRRRRPRAKRANHPTPFIGSFCSRFLYLRQPNRPNREAREKNVRTWLLPCSVFVFFPIEVFGTQKGFQVTYQVLPDLIVLHSFTYI